MSAAIELAPAPAYVTGPTWRRLTTGKWWLPEKSLGWEVLNWMAQNLLQPSGPRAGEAFLPTLEQARFLLWWYAVDEHGRFSYRNGVLRRLKGWGKDPLAAAMSLCELAGPVVFSHWDQHGDPVGVARHSAWIQIAAVSQDQTRNTFTLFPAMASEKLRTEASLELNKTIIFARNGGMIEAVTASPLAMEGKRPTFVIKNETQAWLENNAGHAMSNVITGNVDKAPYGGCRSLAICNAHIPGEDSIAERDWDAYQAVQAGTAVDTGMLYDAIEAPADTPVSELAALSEDPAAYDQALDRLRHGITIARGDAEWLDVDSVIQSILDVRNPVTESRRKFLNQINAAEDSWIAPTEWDACKEPVKLEKGDRITLGFDGSKGQDWTALVACRVEDGALFPVKVWDPEKYDGEIPRDHVDKTVQWCFAQYDVVAFRADVREFESYVDQWAVKFRKKLKLKATPKHPIAYEH